VILLEVMGYICGAALPWCGLVTSGAVTDILAADGMLVANVLVVCVCVSVFVQW